MRGSPKKSTLSLSQCFIFHLPDLPSTLSCNARHLLRRCLQQKPPGIKPSLPTSHVHHFAKFPGLFFGCKCCNLARFALFVCFTGRQPQFLHGCVQRPNASSTDSQFLSGHEGFQENLPEDLFCKLIGLSIDCLLGLFGQSLRQSSHWSVDLQYCLTARTEWMIDCLTRLN